MAAKKSPPRRKKQPKAVVIPTAKDYLRQLRAMKDVSDEDFAFMDDPLAWVSPVEEWLSTGCLALDRLTASDEGTGGGFPIGRVTEIAAWESVGKTTELDQAIGQAQRDGAVAVLVDSEQARDLNYTRALGVNLGELIVHKARTIEGVFSGIDRVLSIQEAHIEALKKKNERPPPMLIAWDGLAGTPTEAEADGSASDVEVAAAAKAVKRNFRRLVGRLPSARAALVFTNQFYQDIGPFASLKTYGGSGVRYFTSLRIWLTRKAALKVGERVVGHVIQAKLRKTRVCRPRPPAELGLIYGAGIHNAYTLFEWGKTAGVGAGHSWVIDKPGAWSYLMPPGEEAIAFKGRWLGFSDVLNERPDIYGAMAAQYRSDG